MNGMSRTLSANLRDLRGVHQLTLEQVAERVGVTRQAAARLLTAAVWTVTQRLALPVILEYLLSLVLAQAGCLALYELRSRTPGVRVLFALEGGRKPR